MDSPTSADGAAPRAWTNGDGLWVWRLERCGGAEAALRAVADLDISALYVKTRDGRDALNAEAEVLARGLRNSHAELYCWAWPYPLLPGRPERTPPEYVEQQAILLAGDAKRLGAAGIILNIEAQWSWSRVHRAGALWARVWPKRADRQRRLAARFRRLLDALRKYCPELPVGVSTFRKPATLPWAEMLRADVIMPQAYFAGSPGFQRRHAAAAAWWRRRGASCLRFSGPAWRGRRPAESFARGLAAVAPAAPADWWVLDSLDAGAKLVIAARTRSQRASAAA